MSAAVTGMKAERTVRRLLLIGLAGALLSMLGDMLLMAFDTRGADAFYGSFLSAARQTTYTRIGLAAFFGWVGIPASGAGFLALCGLTREDRRQSRTFRLYRASAVAFCALGGGVHILCCLILTVLKRALEAGCGDADAISAVWRELGGALVPGMLVFCAVYGVMVVTQILLIAGRGTRLPAWMAWICPLTLKLLLNMARFLGGGALMNGVACSNMSLGCGIILLCWMAAVGKKTGKSAGAGSR